MKIEEKEYFEKAGLYLEADAKRYRITGIGRTVAGANAIIEATGGGVIEANKAGHVIASLIPEKRSGLRKEKDRIGLPWGHFLTVSSMNKVFQVIDISSDEPKHAPGGDELVVVATLPDGRGVYARRYGQTVPST